MDMKVATGAVVRAKLERINRADWRATGLAARAREASGKGMMGMCEVKVRVFFFYVEKKFCFGITTEALK